MIDVILFLLIGHAHAQEFSFALRQDKNFKIEAQGDITWHDQDKKLIARKKALFEQGTFRLEGDILSFFFEGASPFLFERNNQNLSLIAMEAQGQVFVESDTVATHAHHAYYDVKKEHLTLSNPHKEDITIYFPKREMTLRAKKKFIYDGIKKRATILGGGVLYHPRATLAGQNMTAHLEEEQGRQTMTQLIIRGEVNIYDEKLVLLGDDAVYDVNAGIVSVSGNVSIQSDGNSFAGDYGIFDLKKGASRLLTYEEARNLKLRHQAPLPPQQQTEEQKDKKRPSAIIAIEEDIFATPN